MVLRQFDREKCACRFYTDARSPKVAELISNPACSLLFFDKRHMVQLRAEGNAIVEKAEEGGLPADLQKLWDSLPEHGRADYLTKGAPSSPLSDEGDAKSGPITPQNFCRITVTIDYLDWLSLSREGHRRAAFQRTGDTFNGQFLVP